MTILWVCNICINKVAKHLGKPTVPIGGWLSGMFDMLLSDQTNKIIVCFPDSYIYDGKIDDQIKYYSFYKPSQRYERSTENRIVEILIKETPDVIHIHGTEFPHCLATINAAKKQGFLKCTVISIQGIISFYAEHFFANLPKKVIYGHTIKELIKKDNVYNQKKAFQKKGVYEIESIKNCKYIIGRTNWDKSCAKSYSSNVTYFHCDEILREEFYLFENGWKYDQCEKHSIFVSQSGYPIKGFHYVIKALKLLRNKYPDAVLYTTGVNPFDIPFYKMSSYQKYLKKLISSLQLRDSVVFLGSLDAKAMCQRYLNSNVFVSSSTF